MNLVALTGMRTDYKRRALARLIALLEAREKTVTLLDNGDVPFMAVEFPKFRLAGGCVCCTLASGLISTVQRVTTEYALLVVSAHADPEVLRFMLSQLRSAVIRSRIVALLDAHTALEHPYLAQKLMFYADDAIQLPQAEMELETFLLRQIELTLV